MTSTKYSTFISRTAQLHEAVGMHTSRLQIQNHPRAILSFKAGCLSLELAAGTLRLVQEANVSAAFALVRPQFECVVRGMWLLYMASDEWIEKLSQPLTKETAKQGNKAPMLKEMLESLGTRTEPPLQFTVRQLQEFHELGKVVLNSFTHGGMIPLARVGAAYPEWMVLNAIQNSNGVVALATQLLSVLTGDPRNMEPVRQLYEDFQDCLKFERSSFD
jgi:hypothetical protein